MCCQQGLFLTWGTPILSITFPSVSPEPWTEDPVLALLLLLPVLQLSPLWCPLLHTPLLPLLHLLALHLHEGHGATRDSPTSADYVTCVVSETMNTECWVSFLQCACAAWSQQSLICADTPRIFLPLLPLRLRPGFLSSSSEISQPLAFVLMSLCPPDQMHCVYSLSV